MSGDEGRDGVEALLSGAKALSAGAACDGAYGMRRFLSSFG